MPAARSVFTLATAAWHARRRAAAVPEAWDGAAVAASVRAEVAGAEAAGLLDPQLLDAYEAGLVEMIEAEVRDGLQPLRDAVGVSVAERVFGDTVYGNGLDVQLATASAAAAEMVIEQSLVVAASIVSLRLCGLRRPLRPVRVMAGPGGLDEPDGPQRGSETDGDDEAGLGDSRDGDAP